MPPQDADSYLPCVVVDTGDQPTRTVIWLHGLGADGHDFEPIVPELPIPDSIPTRFIFPHADVRPVTLNGGMPMRVWYDILSMEGDRNADQEGILNSAGQVCALIDREISRGIPSEHILLAGFSQGGAMALEVGLRYPNKLAGLLILSAYLLREGSLNTEASGANKDTKILQCHGEYDPVVLPVMAMQCRSTLEGLGYDIDFKMYPVDHGLHPEEVSVVGDWIVDRLK